MRHTGHDESDCSSDSRSIASNDSSDLNLDFLPKGLAHCFFCLLEVFFGQAIHLNSILQIVLGTVVVRPQPVEDDRDEFRGPEFGSKTRSKQTRLLKQSEFLS